MKTIKNYEPVLIDEEQQDNFGRWLKSGESRYREFMGAEYDNGEYYVLTATAFREVKKVVHKDYYYSKAADAECASLLYEDEGGQMRLYNRYEGGASDRLFKFDRETWNARRKKHFMSKYGDYAMPESLKKFMEART
jgi:hypothetical protein